MFPKVVALSLDWTFWQGEFDSNKFGKGPGAVCPAENNLELESEFKIRDKSDHSRTITMYSDVPMIINDLMRNNAFLAIVSRSKSKALCDRALHLFKAVDPTPWSKKLNQKRPIADLVAYNHIYDEEKTVHFHKIWANTGIEYSDMILYDAVAANNVVRVVQGVTFQISRNFTGLTWENYQEGLALWRRSKQIHSPYLGQNLSSYPKRMFIGYAGMDEETVNRMTRGKNRVDLKESARWGYASYVTDNPALAKYFSEWIKKDAFGDVKTYCDPTSEYTAKFLKCLEYF